jgi:Carboxypeptidase regulatory-like domain
MNRGLHALRRIALVLSFVSIAVTAWAQATAQVSGRITDESAAVLRGVTVTVTQTDTGFTRTVVTDQTGAYVMPNLERPIAPGLDAARSAGIPGDERPGRVASAYEAATYHRVPHRAFGALPALSSSR